MVNKISHIHKELFGVLKEREKSIDKMYNNKEQRVCQIFWLNVTLHIQLKISLYLNHIQLYDETFSYNN